MSLTANEIARELGLSTAAVSMALNDKPGVSTDTRKKVCLYAQEHGYDFTRIRSKHTKEGTIYFVIYRKNGAVVDDTPFFTELTNGISEASKEAGQRLRCIYLYESDLTAGTGPLRADSPAARAQSLNAYIGTDCRGVLLLGTEMLSADLAPFLALPIPVVILDSYFETFSCDSVLINNVQGAYMATHQLIRRCKAQPGYLKSSYPINNFQERADGFYKAVRAAGMSSSRCIVHELTPSLSGAYADMSEILSRGEPTARCYFADNDLIAAGALRAFKEAGVRIPEDAAIVGFDNLPIGQVLDPPLSTVDVPKSYMGRQAVLRLLQRIEHPDMPFVKTEIATTLINRYSW